MEAYIITTSIGFVNEKDASDFIEIAEIAEKRIDNFFMRKIKNLLGFKSPIKSNKIIGDENC